MSGVPIRIAVRVDFSDGTQHEYEVRGPDAVDAPLGMVLWPAAVVSTAMREQISREQACTQALAELQGVVKTLRQALWDIYAACGQDTDGDTEAPPPGVWTPDIDTLALAAARSLRQDYDEALREP